MRLFPLTQPSVHTWGMPSYYEWNTALIEHVTHGAPLGSTVYLEVSEESLARVGVQRWGTPPDGMSWRDDFVMAVQAGCLLGDRVTIDWMRGEDPRGRPLGVAFLGAMVLAASNMAADAAQAVHAKNYFRRLAEVLGLPRDVQGRPAGLPVGAEEPLWQAWVAFLRSRGYDSTARGGEGAWRFTGYPVSQSLIPRGERQRLARLFAERGYPATWDGETIASRLRAEGGVSVKVRELLHRTGAAAEDVQGALQEVLQAWHASGVAGGDVALGAALSARQVVAGLYREEHWLTREPEYRLFPRQPRGVRLSAMHVELLGGAEALVVERPGYYRPVGTVTPADLHVGARYVVAGSAFVDALVLPARDYWVLRPDPDSAGQFASLGTPGVGEHLVLLLRDTLLEDVQRFREEGLLAWQGDAVPVGDGWLELHGVMVTANHWADVPAGKARGLHDALRPAGGISIHVEGGVRTQRAGAYLVGGEPQVRIMSFYQQADLTVLRNGVPVDARPVTPGETLIGVLGGPGEYELIAEARGARTVRLLSVVNWEELRAADVTPGAVPGVPVGGWHVLGAAVRAGTGAAEVQQ